jgi:serine/threonine protein kinase
MNELIGRQIDHYRIDALLGEGGMGAVYRAYDLNLARPVAFKVMHGNLASQDEFKARFMQEAQSAAKLNHPSIVTVHYFGAGQGLLFMVMSYIPGGSLNTHMRELQQRGEAVQLREILLFMAQVADALGYAHRQGVVHRDIKPSNVLIQRLDTSDSAGGIALRAVVTDFGLAKLLSGGVETKSDTLLGTYPYMSPEQCLQQPIDGRSDLYSLGVMLYQLTTGKMPLEIHSATDAVLKHHLKEKPVAPRQAWPALPVAVENIIVKAIAHDPADRYQNGEAIAADLREAARTLPAEDITQFESQRNVKSLVTRLEADEPAEPSNMGSDLPFPGTSDRLIIAQKDHTPRSMAITKKQLNLGRTNENEIVLDHSDVSRRHASLEQTSTGWQITDLGSTNGTFIEGNKLLPNIPEPLQPGKTFRIGPFAIYWKRAEARPATKSQARSIRSSVLGMTGIQSSSGQIGANLQPARLEIAPGTHEQMQVELFNGGDLVDHFKLSVKNFPGEWVTLSDPLAELMPGANTTVMVDIHPPMDSTARAGSHQLQLQISSISKPTETITVPADIVIKPFERFSVQLQPSQIPQGGTAHITINNQGNAEAAYSIVGRDPANAIQFVGEQGRVRVPPGQTSSQALQVKAKSRPFFGTMQTLPFDVQVKSAMIEQPQVMPGQLRVAPYLPIWVLSLLIILITLCLAIGGLGYSQVVVPSNNTKVAATAAFNQNATLSAQNAAQNAQSTAVASTGIAQTAAAQGDNDGDGLSNQKETELQTDPNNRDTDGDGLTDGQEVNQYGTDPRNIDSDSDSLVDGQEVNVAHTQPKNPDTDGDGIPDGLDPDPLAAPTATVAPPTDTPPPSPTAIVSAFNGEWRGTVTTKPANVSYAIAQLIVGNVNPQGNLASIHLCRCNSDTCDARVVVSPLQAQAGVDGLKLVTTEPFYISDTRFWILKAIRNDKQLIVTVEEHDSQTQALATVPNDLTLRRPTNQERNTAFSCSSPVFTVIHPIILNPNMFLVVIPTPPP